jgi:hypothetical protein
LGDDSLRDDEPGVELDLRHCSLTASPDGRYNDPSSTTRPTRRLDCNSDAMAGFAAADG